MDKTTIIVVEDNIVYCEFVCNMLAREGYRTVKAYHLSTAKKHLQQATDNDIVVADLRQPSLDGQRHRPRGTYLRHRRDGLYQQRQYAAKTARPDSLQDIRY